MCLSVLNRQFPIEKVLYIYVKRKVWIQTILGFCCTNLESTRNHLGSCNQTSAIRGNKPTIDRASEAAWPFAETKPQLIVHAQSSSTFCGKEATNDRTRKAAHPSQQRSTIDRAVAHAIRLWRQRWLTINK